MGIDEHLADGWVTTLELNAAFDRPWVDRAVEWVLAGAGPAVAGGLAVDVGCGAGGAACAFARRVGTAGGPGAVLGLDRDPRLVAQARRRAEAEGVARTTRWGLGEVGRLPVRAGTAGLAWASGVVHHVPDQQAALGELAGLLVPGGTLALVEGGLPLRCLPHEIGLGRPGLEARLDEARARWFVDLRAELGGPPLPYGWPEALARAGLAGVRTRSFLAEATPPLDDVGRQVATLHLANARSELGDRLDADDRATLDRLLDPADEAWVGHRGDLVVTAVRTVHAATRPAP